MLKVKIIAVGKVKEKYYSAAAEEYIKRITRFAQIKLIEIKEELITKSGDAQIEKALSAEGDEILKNASGYVCVLAIEGKKLTSTDFSKLICESAMKGGEISFVIGSSNGLCDKVKNRADFLLSFSDMTFPHTMFRVLLTEQIYRAFCIAANTSYHK